MKRLFHSICMTALLELVATWPHAVRAQDVAHGTFVLPCEAQWQGKTLERGEYHFRLPSARVGGVISIRDAKGRTKLLVVMGPRDDFSGASILTIVERNGKNYVSSLAIKEIGAKLEYPVPGQKTGVGERREAAVHIIPIQIAGNRSYPRDLVEQLPRQ